MCIAVSRYFASIHHVHASKLKDYFLLHIEDIALVSMFLLKKKEKS